MKKQEGLKRDIQVTRAIAEAFPEIDILVDGNDGFTVDESIQYLEGLGDADIRTDTKPLPADPSAYLGNYRYDRGDEGTFQIVETRGGLGLETPGNFPRSLFHLGANEFHPGGARSIRVRFSFEGDVASRVEIYDPELSIRALREL